MVYAKKRYAYCYKQFRNSPNVVNAVKAAERIGGTVITLSAMSPDNSIRKMGDINFYIPAQTYGMAETAHAAILHFWMDSIEIRT
ncbi:hypothetical protein QUF75_06660 [Desulfococcaceae bacterium HSG7]|nr:hypothetical protein [Desulfococcaceae bacterium HSG7]